MTNKRETPNLRLIPSVDGIEAEIEALVERDRKLQATIEAPKARQAELDALQQQRVNEIAQGMAQGRNADTTRIDAGIASAQKAAQDATETATAAQAARELIYSKILDLKKRIASIERDTRIAGIGGFAERNAALRQSETEANERALHAQAEADQARSARRRNAVNFLVGKAEQGIRAAEEFIPALSSVIEALAPNPADDGPRNIPVGSAGVGHPWDARPAVKINEAGKRAPVTSDDLQDILRRIELPLKAAAPFAEVAAETFEESATKIEMLTLLKRFGPQLLQVVRKHNVTVSSVLLMGDACWRDWVSAEHTAPVYQVLRDAGVDC